MTGTNKTKLVKKQNININYKITNTYLIKRENILICKFTKTTKKMLTNYYNTIINKKIKINQKIFSKIALKNESNLMKKLILIQTLLKKKSLFANSAAKTMLTNYYNNITNENSKNERSAKK